MYTTDEFLIARRNAIIGHIINNSKQIPDYIKRLSYIYNTDVSSDTSPYIDTNYYPNKSTKIVIKIESMNSKNSDSGYYTCPYGVRSNNGYRLICYDNLSNYEFSIYTGKYKYFYPKSGFTADLETSTIEHSSDGYTLSSKIENYNAKIDSVNQWQSESPLYLFACNYQGEILKPYYGKIYYIKIFENDIAIKHLVPIYNEIQNIAGMYDLINNVEYYSPNGKSFSIGQRGDNFEL